MKNISTILLYAIIFAALSILTSCGESQSAKKLRDREEAKAAEDSAIGKSQPVDPPGMEPQVYSFHPARIEMSHPAEVEHDTIGEGEHPAHTFEVKFYFIDSLNQEFAVYISGNQYLDSKDSPEELQRAKNAYEEITSAALSALTVSISQDKERIRVERESVTLHEKVGDVTVRPTHEVVLLWEGYLSRN